MRTSNCRRANVRFSKNEYAKLQRDQLVTGRSVPWLLKTAYFKNEISAPTLDTETRTAVRRELSAIGNNLNQLTRLAHLEVIGGLREQILECIHAIRTLKSYLGQDYGNR